MRRCDTHSRESGEFTLLCAGHFSISFRESGTIAITLKRLTLTRSTVHRILLRYTIFGVISTCGVAETHNILYLLALL
jgi:hypothetical protein